MAEQEQDNEPKYSEEEVKELADFLTKSGAVPTPEERYNVHSFLHSVATEKDTTKVGNLDITELGKPKYPERTLKELGLISKELVLNAELGSYFDKEAEILTSTSLSKDGFLVKQATTTTRQIADVTRKKVTENKGWFKKKDPAPEGGTATQ